MRQQGMVQKATMVCLRMGLTVLLMWGGVGAGPAWAQATASLQDPRTLKESAISPEQADWLQATAEQRVQLAEQLGEQGARQYAEQQGWEPIYQGTGRQMRQGLDQVYRHPRTGKIIVIEAKGGTSPIARGYGYEQGTPEWAVKSAENVLHSSNASVAEREAAKQVIAAARRGQVEVQVVRTEHVLGKPSRTTVEQVRQCTKKAQELAEEIAKLRGLDAAGGSALQGSPSKPSRNGRIHEEPSAEPYSSNGVAGGAKPASRQIQKTAQQLGTTGRPGEQAGVPMSRSLSRAGADAYEETAKISPVLGRAGKAAGVAAVGIDAGFRLYEAYQVEQDYQHGQISQHERNKAHVKNAATAASGYAGGALGGWGGAKAGAVVGTAICPGIGTAIGGAIGGIAGAIGGYFAGDKAADMAVEYMMGP